MAEFVADGSVTVSHGDQYFGQVGASLTDRAGYAVLINNAERNRKLHHISHCSDIYGYQEYDNIWFLFDDVALCYIEADGQLTYSHYVKFYGHGDYWAQLKHNQADTSWLTPFDPRYNGYRQIAENKIARIVESIRVFHPT
jgi:hypothetical protein